MKNEKGFTLIELLVTIALMLSILSIAIVSVVKVSDIRKEDAYRLQKEQIINAAETYLSSYAYYKEALVDENSAINISLGLLVEEDYLNVVTNVLTNKQFNKCNFVKVTKGSNNRLEYEFIDKDVNCNENAYIVVEKGTNKGALDFNYSVEGKKGNDGWYILNSEDKPTPIIKLIASDRESSVVSIAKKISDTETQELEIYPDYENNTFFAIDGDSFSQTTKGVKEVTYIANNRLGATKEITVGLKVDVDPPTCTIKTFGLYYGGKEGNSHIYYQTLLTPVKTSISSSDVGSGIDSKSNEMTYLNPKSSNKDFIVASVELDGKYHQSLAINRMSSSRIWRAQIKDIAGNTNYCEKTIEVRDAIDGIINSIPSITCGDSEGSSTTWTNSDRTITQHFNEKKNGEIKDHSENITFNTTIKTGEIEWEGKKCEVDVYVDRTKPEYSSIEFSKTGYITFQEYQKVTGGTKLLQTRDIPVKYNETSEKYEGTACLKLATLGKNVTGSYNFSGFTTYATDKGSGINSNSWTRAFKITTNQGITGTHCFSTKGENPCVYENIIYVKDKVGNRSDNLGKLKIKVGYVGIDSFCNGW